MVHFVEINLKLKKALHMAAFEKHLNLARLSNTPIALFTWKTTTSPLWSRAASPCTGSSRPRPAMTLRAASISSSSNCSKSWRDSFHRLCKRRFSSSPSRSSTRCVDASFSKRWATNHNQPIRCRFYQNIFRLKFLFDILKFFWLEKFWWTIGITHYSMSLNEHVLHMWTKCIFTCNICSYQEGGQNESKPVCLFSILEIKTW